MPYYIDPEQSAVFVGGFHGEVKPTLIEIDSKLASRLDLRHGQPLTDAQINALRAGSASDFRLNSPPELVQGSPAFVDFGTTHATASTDAPNLPASVNRASSAAGIVEGFTWLILVLTVIGGLIIAAQTSNDGYETTHPYVGYGIGIAIGGSINCLMIIMVAAYIKAKMELARIGR